jgi:peptidoglycan/LPS O-acetylase OafA/YrhL
MRGFSLSESYTGEDDEAHQGLDRRRSSLHNRRITMLMWVSVTTSTRPEGSMRWMNRQRLWRSVAVLVAALAVVFVAGWSATGVDGGVVSAIAISVAIAVAIFGGTDGSCSPRLFRRRD